MKNECQNTLSMLLRDTSLCSQTTYENKQAILRKTQNKKPNPAKNQNQSCEKQPNPMSEKTSRSLSGLNPILVNPTGVLDPM
jgi:hypothetical protein